MTQESNTIVMAAAANNLADSGRLIREALRIFVEDLSLTKGYRFDYCDGPTMTGYESPTNTPNGPSYGDPTYAWDGFLGLRQDSRPDVNCIGLVKTPGKGLNCKYKNEGLATAQYGDVFYFITAGGAITMPGFGTPSALNFPHVGFLSSGPRLSESTPVFEFFLDGAFGPVYEFDIFHCLERGKGPTTSQHCLISSDGRVVLLDESRNPILDLDRFNSDGTVDKVDLRTLRLKIIDRPVFTTDEVTLNTETPIISRMLDPMILDMDRNGIQTCGLDADIHFDHDGNGFKEL
ncbi:MAG: hypothetical protein V2B18_16430, partial [Pseudomonadota bacterium]